MKRFNSYRRVLLSLTVVGMLATACDDNDEIAVDPDAEYDVELNVPTETNENVDVTPGQGSIKAKVTFASTDKSMKRLYITKNVGGQGEEVFEPLENIDTKDDGSVDLTGKDDKNFEYAFELPVPSGITAGTVIYKFWTTTGNGDIRDVTQRLAVGPSTITLVFGGQNQAAAVKTFSDKVLAAPLLDGTSNSFISSADGTIYKISSGVEYVTFWDFGYMYLTSGNQATLSSASKYNTKVVDIPKIGQTTADELNKVYFKASTKSSADFDAAKVSSDLNSVTAAITDNQEITNLEAGDIVEFLDQYGKKGLIRVDAITGTDGSNGSIKIDIKVQP